ncbi:unnamed protein product, partial [Rotaria sp. Silwood1]
MRGIGSGKVLESGPDDNVFVFFTDHGAVGLVAFPNGVNLGKHHNVSEFQGEGAQSMKSIRNPFIDRYNDLLKRDAVATVDVRVSTVSRRLASSESEVEKAALEHELVKLLNNEFVLNKLWIMANLCEIGPGNLKWNKNGITIMDNGYGSDPDQLQYAE